MKRSLFTVILLYAAFIVFTVLVCTVDVRPIGPMGSEVGFASLNGAFHELTGTHMFWYELTEVFGVLAILICAVFGIFGVYLLVIKRSLLKVDRDILILGGFYIAVIAFYVLFEFVTVNYRPVLTGEGLEASYPSSHTMLIICVMSTTIMQLRSRIKGKLPRLILMSICTLILILTVIGRLICGVHWLTDIVGGVLLSAALVYSYFTLSQ